MFSRFDTIPACDRQTDGRTDGQTESLYLRRASAWLTHVKMCVHQELCYSVKLQVAQHNGEMYLFSEAFKVLDPDHCKNLIDCFLSQNLPNISQLIE